MFLFLVLVVLLQGNPCKRVFVTNCFEALSLKLKQTELFVKCKRYVKVKLSWSRRT